MKNWFLAVSVMFLVVVCPVQAQRISVPVGEQAVTDWQWSRGVLAQVYLMDISNDGRIFGWVNNVSPKLEDIVRSVDRMQFSLDIDVSKTYVVEAYVDAPDNIGVGAHSAILRFRGRIPFKLLLQDGKLVLPPEAKEFPTATDLACMAPKEVFMSTVTIPTTEVKWVENGWTYPGLSIPSTITRNGWGTNCWASALFGNGYIYIDGWVLSGRRLKTVQEVDGPNAGEFIILWYDEGRTIGDRWDIGSGVWTPIGPVSTDLKTAVKVSSGTFAVATSGAVPGASYTLESVDIVGGSSTVVGTLSATDSGWLFWYLPVDTNRSAKFFNVRPARAGDPAPQKAVAQAGFSFP